MSGFWGDAALATLCVNGVSLALLVENMFHGKRMCKYLKSDMWVFNRIACLSVEELDVLTSNRGGP